MPRKLPERFVAPEPDEVCDECDKRRKICRDCSRCSDCCPCPDPCETCGEYRADAACEGQPFCLCFNCDQCGKRTQPDDGAYPHAGGNYCDPCGSAILKAEEKRTQ